MRKLIIAGILAGALIIPASASAMVPVKVNPAAPIVDDTVITVSFKVKKRLPASKHYEVALIGNTGYDCSSFVNKVSKKRPKAGKTFSMMLSTTDDILGGYEWCQGKAFINVSVNKNGNDEGGGSIIGIKEFRFYGRP